MKTLKILLVIIFFQLIYIISSAQYFSFGIKVEYSNLSQSIDSEKQFIIPVSPAFVNRNGESFDNITYQNIVQSGNWISLKQYCFFIQTEHTRIIQKLDFLLELSSISWNYQIKETQTEYFSSTGLDLHDAYIMTLRYSLAYKFIKYSAKGFSPSIISGISIGRSSNFNGDGEKMSDEEILYHKIFGLYGDKIGIKYNLGIEFEFISRFLLSVSYQNYILPYYDESSMVKTELTGEMLVSLGLKIGKFHIKNKQKENYLLMKSL